ncbi:hypothetical protein HDU78_001107 [Chytriomyces hyalinus]|nr:hypothetical protein HDU78_001107 [Chytriomyces hyalinus]
MFSYSNTLFTFETRSDSAGMGVVWIAGTFGAPSASAMNASSKGGFKRLSRKEVSRVDLGRVCNYLINPPEPLALRLSSNLMFGATRVLSNQVAFLYSDANNVSIRLKKVFLDASTGASIDMANAETTAAAITLVLGDEEALLADETFAGRSFQKERELGWARARVGHRQSIPIAPVDEEDDLYALPQLAPPVLSNSLANRATNSNISIPSAPALYPYALSQSLGSVSGASRSNNIFDFDDSTGNGSALGAGTSGSFGTDDREHRMSGIDTVGNVGLAVEDPNENLELDFNFGGFEADPFRPNFDEFVAADHVETGRTEAAPPRSRPGMEADESFDFNPIDDNVVPTTELEENQKNLAEIKSVTASATTSRKRAKKSYRDAKLEISNVELRTMGDVASAALLTAEKNRIATEANSKMIAYARDSFNRFHLSYGPALRGFYSDLKASSESLYVRERIPSKKRKAPLGHEDESIQDSEKFLRYESKGKENYDVDPWNAGGREFPDEFDGAQVEFGLANSADGQSFQGISMDIETGVAAPDISLDSGLSARRSMPWVTASLNSNRSVRYSNLKPMSVGSKRASAAGSLSSDGAGANILGDGSSWGQDDFSGPMLSSHDDYLLDSLRSNNSLTFKDTQERLARGAEESFAFLQYAKKAAIERGTSHVYLQSMVQNLNSRSASSQAFYHVLFLSTSRKIQVSQSAPYEDIKLSFLNDDDDDFSD